MLGMLSTMFSGAMLYAPGAFFFYPWKAALLWLFGSSYDTAYTYFRRDHSDALNLTLHCVALIWQLFTNFSLLAAMDDMFFSSSWLVEVGLRPLSLFTAVSWSLTLICSPAPLWCSLASTVSITAACIFSPEIPPERLELFMMGMFLGIVCFVNQMPPANRQKLKLENLKKAIVLVFSGGFRLCAMQWRGVFAAEAQHLNLALAALMVALALLPKPVIPCVLGGVFVARLLAELTGQGFLLSFGGAFLAQLAQGVAHDVSGQQATLLSHQDHVEDRCQRLAFEWSHCVYFPCLLFQSIGQSLSSRRKVRKESKS